MAKYQFDFSGFTLADLAEAVTIGRGRSSIESNLITRMLNAFAPMGEYQYYPYRFQEDKVGTAISILNFAVRFADGRRILR